MTQTVVVTVVVIIMADYALPSARLTRANVLGTISRARSSLMAACEVGTVTAR